MPANTFRPSNEQKAILEAHRRGDPLTIVTACAGAGKTASILHALNASPELGKRVYLVFNSFMRSEIDRKLKNPNTIFKNITKDGLDVYTLHGYMRKKIAEFYPDVGFDYLNGSLTKERFDQLLRERLQIERPASMPFFRSVIHLFNAFNASTLDIEEFIEDDTIKMQLDLSRFEAIFDGSDFIKEIGNALNLPVLDITPEAGEELILAFCYRLLDLVYEESALNDALPHDIYYKLAFLQQKDSLVDLFPSYASVLVDEAQDLDDITLALLKQSRKPLLLLGDSQQQIYAFRGSSNILDKMGRLKDRDITHLSLSKSYRLSPSNAFACSALIRHYSPLMGIDESMNIYGNSSRRSSSFLESRSSDDFSKRSVETILSPDFSHSPSYMVEKEKGEFREAFEREYPKGRKGAINKALKALYKQEEPVALDALMAIIDDFAPAYDLPLTGTLYEHLEISQSDAGAQKLLDALFKPKSRTYKKDIVAEKGTFALLGRNNRKVLEMAYRFIKNVPMGKEDDLPLFYIRFTSTLADKLDMLAHFDMSPLSSKRETNAMLLEIRSLTDAHHGKGFFKSVLSARVTGQMVYDAVTAVIDEHDDPALVSIGGWTHHLDTSLMQKRLFANVFGLLNESRVRELLLDDSERQAYAELAKKRDKREAIEFLVSRKLLPMNAKAFKLTEFVRLDELLFDLPESAFYSASEYVDLLHKHGHIALYSESNPLIELSDTIFNVYLSTIHQVKGLEFDHVFLSNDLIEHVTELDSERQVDEFNLAYVSMSRARDSITFESVRDHLSGIESTSLFRDTVMQSMESYRRLYRSSSAVAIESYLEDEQLFKIDVSTTTDTTTLYLDQARLPNVKDLMIAIHDATDKISEVIDLSEDRNHVKKDKKSLRYEYFKEVPASDDDGIMRSLESAGASLYAKANSSEQMPF